MLTTVDIPLLDIVDVPFNASDYTGKGSMTWAVSSCRSRVGFINKTMFWWLGMDVLHSIVGGIPNNQLFVKLPFFKRVAQPGFSAPGWMTHIDASLHPEMSLVNVGDPDDTHIALVRPSFANFVPGGLLVSVQPVILEVA